MTRKQAALGLVLALACAALATLIATRLAGHTLAFALLGTRYEIVAPQFFGLAALYPLIVWGFAASLTDLPSWQRVLSLIARSVLLCLVVCALARPARSYDATRVAAVMLVDVSDSISDADLRGVEAQVDTAWRGKGDNVLQVVTFATRSTRVSLPRNADERVRLTRHTADVAPDTAGARTDIQAALQLAYGLLPKGHLKRVLIFSDGRQTDGDLAGEADRARKLGVHVLHQLLADDGPREVAVRSLELPEQISVGESFELRARIFASYDARVRLHLYQDHVLNGLDGVRDVDLSRGETTVVFKSIVRVAGDVAYRLVMEPSGPDRFVENNSVSATAVVPGHARVLIVDSEPARLGELSRALSVADFDVEVRGAAALPRSLAELAATISSSSPTCRPTASAPRAWRRSSATCATWAAGSCSPAARRASASAATRGRAWRALRRSRWIPSDVATNIRSRSRW